MVPTRSYSCYDVGLYVYLTKLKIHFTKKIVLIFDRMTYA